MKNMQSRSRLLMSIGLVLLVLIVVVALFIWRTTGTTASTAQSCQAPKQPLKTMTLALDWTPNTNHTGIYVAQAKCWYSEQGIDLKILPYSASVSPDVLVSSGKADVGISSTEGIVADAAAGQPVVSIAAISQHNTSALVTLATSDLKRPRDLDGKVYGAFGAPYESPVVSQVIKQDGGQGDFKSVTLNVDALQALESHRIDFVWVFEGVEGIQAKHQGIKLNVFPITQYGIADYYTPNIITSPATIGTKARLLHAFMTATAQGYEFAQTHVQEATQDLISQTPRGTFPDQSYLQDSQQFLSSHYVDAGRKWGVQDAATWHSYPQFIMDKGGVTDASGQPVHHLNLDALYTNQFLP